MAGQVNEVRKMKELGSIYFNTRIKEKTKVDKTDTRKMNESMVGKCMSQFCTFPRHSLLGSETYHTCLSSLIIKKLF